jgi:predicted phage-related endonuclease
VAHPDYEIVATAKGPGLLELKMRDRMGMGAWEEGVPHDVALQVAHQLAVKQWDWARVGVLFGGNTFKIYELQRDLELEEYLIQIESQFLVRVEKGQPPDADWEKDHSLIKQLYPKDSGAVITLDDPDVLTVCGELVEAKAKLKEYEEYKESAEAFLKDKMQTASEAIVPMFGSITWKNTKPTQTLDKDKLEKDFPDVFRQCLVERPGYRRFLVKPSKEIKAT